MDQHDIALRASLDALVAGDARSAQSLFDLLYEQLRKRAARLLDNERAGHSLQPTEIVHEVWLRVVNGARDELRGRAHFAAIAARAMRQVLIDYARKRTAQKRGEGKRVPMPSDVEIAPGAHVDAFDLAEALAELEARFPREGQIATTHLLVQETLERIAAQRGASFDSVRDDWRFARDWLNRRLKSYRPEADAR